MIATFRLRSRQVQSFFLLPAFAGVKKKIETESAITQSSSARVASNKKAQNNYYFGLYFILNFIFICK